MVRFDVTTDQLQTVVRLFPVYSLNRHRSVDSKSVLPQTCTTHHCTLCDRIKILKSLEFVLMKIHATIKVC